MDQKISISGSVISVTLVWMGKWSLSDVALFFGALSGAATFGFTAYKMAKEIIKDFKNK
jgi:hypothetical protein